jgi:hypothetical protein
MGKIFLSLIFKIAFDLLILVGPALCQCPDTGQTKVFKPNSGTGYYFYHFIGQKSFVYFLDGKKFSLADKNESGRDYFFIDNMAFEVVLENKSNFKNLIKATGPQGLLEAQAQFEQNYYRKLLPSVSVTDFGPSWRVDKSGKPDRLFYLWKKQNSGKDQNGLQYLLSTPLDDDVVVLLSVLILKNMTESEVFDQIEQYTGHFDLLSSDECKEVLATP